MEEFIDCVNALIAQFRELGAGWSAGGKTSPDLGTVYLFADEYLSLKTETHACRLMEILGEGRPGTLRKISGRRLMDIVRREIGLPA